MKKNKKKTKKWIKARHTIVRKFLSPFVCMISRRKFGLRAKKFKEQGKRNYLIIANHQTGFDQFFVERVFRGKMYFVASEDLFSNGFASKLLRYFFAPIPIKKQLADMRAVMNVVKVAKEGASIMVFPEGNRTFSGTTEYFKPAIVKLAKLTGLPIAFVRIEGGYGTEPRWANKSRKGRSTAYVSKIVEPEEYKKLSEEELFTMITENIYVDEREIDGQYKSKRLAEYVERALYVCPHCGLTTFYSNKNDFKCLKCGRTATYNTDKTLSGDFEFKFVKEWYEYQKDFINKLNLSTLTSEPVYTDTARFNEVRLYKNKIKLEKQATISLYGDRITVNGKKHNFEFKFDDLSAVTVLGRNKVNLYFNDKVYQIKPEKRFNALRYVHFFNRYINIKENTGNEFLGL